MTDLVFVYGTLLPGQAAHRAHASLFVGAPKPGSVRGTLFALPEGYPMLVLDAAGAPVRGMVLRLREPTAGLERLDAYEGCDPARPDESLYRRDALAIRLDDGETPLAWVYHAPSSRVAQVRARGRRLSGGDWVAGGCGTHETG